MFHYKGLCLFGEMTGFVYKGENEIRWLLEPLVTPDGKEAIRHYMRRV